MEGPRGTFLCGHCPRCPLIQEGTTFTLPNREIFPPSQHANCGTRGVIYLMVCACKAFYVGDNLYYSTNGKLSMVGRHIGIHYRFQPDSVKFLVLEVIPEDPRGGVFGSRYSETRGYLDRATQCPHTPRP